VAHSPRRSRRLQGLDPPPLPSEVDTPLASSPTPVNPPEVNQGIPSYFGFDIRSENNPFSSPIPDPSGIHTIGSPDSDVVRLDYSSFSFDPHTPVTIDDLSVEVNRLSVNQRPTRDPYLLHYNQPLTDPYGPIVQQLTQPSVSPWQNNIWYQQILKDSQPIRPTNLVTSSSYSTPAMSLFETDKIPLQEENYGDSNNLMDKPLYTWSTGAHIPFGELLFPPLQPKTITMVDRGDQYVNPFVQPHIRPTTSTCHNIPPTHYAHTQIDLSLE